MSSIIPRPLSILIVDDEPGIREMLEILFKREGYAVVSAAGHKSAVEALSGSPAPFAVVLTDLQMPDGSGLDVLAAAKHRSPSTEVILITAHGSVENAIHAMRHGAYDFVTKPFAPAQLVALVAKALERQALFNENEKLRAQVSHYSDREIAGKSPAMRKVLDLIGRIAQARTTVLLTGESGTGKERVARAIHAGSERRNEPFLVVNCGALPEHLMESELFGHEKGAFTGASSRHNGMFREADGGTLLLDEVGELPLSLQVKLLRVLQERSVRPVGGSQEIPVDVRLLAATNRDIEADVASGKFRQDLFYRLNVIRLELPPLRERREDIPALLERFLKLHSAELAKDIAGFTPDALRALSGYNYPGNVRELENIVERAVALAGSRVIGLGDLPRELSGQAGATTGALLEVPEAGCQLDDIMNEVERRMLLQALERTGGVRTAAAKLLGITFRSLRYRLEKHALDLGSDEDADSSREAPE